MKDKLELFFDMNKLKDIPACPDLVWDRRNLMEDEVVKVKKSDLEHLINSNVKAYQALGEIKEISHEVADKIREAYDELEGAPVDIDELIIEDVVDLEEEVR